MILVYINSTNGISKSSYEAITYGKKLGDVIALTNGGASSDELTSLGQYGASKVLIDRAIDASQLKEFISSLEHGIKTIVGENGVRLSGGQLQRIGIARALYNNSEILVLDEATSALDQKTELDFIEAVNNIKGNKTILIITHRLSTIDNCDKIFKIEKAKLFQTK